MRAAARASHRARPERYLRQRRLARECALQFLYQADLQQDWGCDAARLTQFHTQVSGLDAWPGDDQAKDAWAFAQAHPRGYGSS